MVLFLYCAVYIAITLIDRVFCTTFIIFQAYKSDIFRCELSFEVVAPLWRRPVG